MRASYPISRPDHHQIQRYRASLSRILDAILHVGNETGQI